jgi:hypothetical protein
MSTNFYMVFRCEHEEGCGEEVTLHLGKNSVGWQFMFQALPDRGIFNCPGWIHLMTKKGGIIVDEYRRVYTMEEFSDYVAETYNGNLKERGDGAYRCGHEGCEYWFKAGDWS